VTHQGRENDEGTRERLRKRVDKFGRRLQEEAKGIESRVKEGIQESVEESKHRDRRLGRPPGLSRRPPSGRPPSGRPPSI
jgi:hypothetical protein